LGVLDSVSEAMLFMLAIAVAEYRKQYKLYR
jgi:hypothetical protein